jgi:hypothetical protein
MVLDQLPEHLGGDVELFWAQVLVAHYEHVVLGERLV